MFKAYITLLALAAVASFSGCESTYQDGFRAGYEQGQVDSTRRAHLATANLHRWQGDADSGTTRYYSAPGQETTVDGRKLVPNTITVPVKE